MIQSIVARMAEEVVSDPARLFVGVSSDFVAEADFGDDSFTP
jgi:hypothetical protein